MKHFFGIFTGGCIGQLILIFFFAWLIWAGVSLVIDKVDEAGSVPKAIGSSFKFIKEEFNEGANGVVASDTIHIDTIQIK